MSTFFSAEMSTRKVGQSDLLIAVILYILPPLILKSRSNRGKSVSWCTYGANVKPTS